MEIGIYNNLSNDDYHNDREYISSSVIKTAYSSLPKYKARYIDGLRQNPSDALKIGNAFHTQVLEPELWEKEWMVFDNTKTENRLTTKKGKEAYSDMLKEAEKKGKTVIKATDLRDVESMAASVKRNKLARPLISHPNGEAEVSVFSICPVTGHRVKVRFDYIDVESGIIVDLKSSKDATKHSFKNDCFYYLHYDLSAAMYLDIAKQVYGKDFTFYWIVTDKRKEQDFMTAVYKVSEETYQRGRGKYLQGINNILKATMENNFQYQTEIEEL